MTTCPRCGSPTLGPRCRRCWTVTSNGRLSGLFSSKGGSSKEAKKAQKAIQKSIKEAGAVQAAATKQAAQLGLQAQQVHEEGEVAKARIMSIIKWGAIIGGGALVVMLVLGAMKKK